MPKGNRKSDGWSFEMKFLLVAVLFYAVVGYYVYYYLIDDLGYRKVPDYEKEPLMPRSQTL